MQCYMSCHVPTPHCQTDIVSTYNTDTGGLRPGGAAEWARHGLQQGHNAAVKVTWLWHHGNFRVVLDVSSGTDMCIATQLLKHTFESPLTLSLSLSLSTNLRWMCTLELKRTSPDDVVMLHLELFPEVARSVDQLVYPVAGELSSLSRGQVKPHTANGEDLAGIVV
jgi:hypothetical protein